MRYCACWVHKAANCLAVATCRMNGLGDKLQSLIVPLGVVMQHWVVSLVRGHRSGKRVYYLWFLTG